MSLCEEEHATYRGDTMQEEERLGAKVGREKVSLSLPYMLPQRRRVKL
jgi:hypothetical protein